MFFFETGKDSNPFNNCYNVDTIKSIEYTNLRYMNGSRLEKNDSFNHDNYEVFITFKDETTTCYEICEDRDIGYFFKQLEKLGLE